MSAAYAHQARHIAVTAAKRGLIEPHVLWDVACQWAAGAAETPRELFDGVLSEDQLDEIAGPANDASGDARRAPLPGGGGRDPQETIDSVRAETLPGSGTPIALQGMSALGRLEGERYEVGKGLGIGGSGKVVRAHDRQIGRVVAMKTLKLGSENDPMRAGRFVAEARVTAQLEHPNIVPVYDLGTLPSGQPYYTMRVVKRQSLHDVLDDPRLKEQWPLVRLVGAFVQISRALAYAHERRVLHRDIKPENILLGDFGEVYLADWGIAKLMSSPGARYSVRPPSPEAPPRDERFAPVSTLTGTPGYIAPEQIRGDEPGTDHRADIFALGVVLYEMLTNGEHPFDAQSADQVLLATLKRDPKRPRDVVPTCPLVLDDLCMSMLAKDASKRPASAHLVAEEAEAFLEGAKERARRREEAGKLCELAKVPVERDRSLDAERERLVVESRKLLIGLKGYEPVEKKRPGWELEDRAATVSLAQARALAEAIDLYTKALGYDPEFADARSGLATLYYSRAVKADEERRHASRVYYEALVSELDVGAYSALLGEEARISLESNPAGAEVIAYRYVERDRVLVAGEERRLGRTPLSGVRLPPGSYLLLLELGGLQTVRYPVLLGRGSHHHGRVNLYTKEEIGDGFVYVPAGACLVGGDAEASDPLLRTQPVVSDFAIAQFPVTFREYCDFLDAIGADDPALAAKRAPHDPADDGYVVGRNEAGRWEPANNILEGKARAVFPAEEGHLWKLPVLLINWFDALAFSRWRSSRDGIEIRLPTELEWEKAARGVDGRFHPWGDRFDPTFCLMRNSRPFLAQPEPVGTFSTDTSPYGVRDMAGGMREWVADIHGERTWAELSAEPEPPVGAERNDSSWRVLRSGSWATEGTRCRSASRGRYFALARLSSISFRLARSLVPRPRG